MANETRDYLDRYSRITADNVLVTLFRLNDDGTYQAREVATGAEYPVSRPNRVTWYRLNERVEVSRPSATRNVVGAMPVILTPGPMEQRGLSATTPNEAREGSGRVVILSVDPDPLVLELGGASGVQVIIGTGFESLPATYANPIAAGADPTLTDDAVPVATDTKVTMTISADAGGAIGEFDVLVNGARAPKALRIRDPIITPPEYGFFVLADSATNELVTLKDYFAETVTSRSAALSGTVLRVVQIDNTHYLAFVVGGGAHHVALNSVTGAFTVAAVGTHPAPWSSRAQFTVVGDLIYYGDDAFNFVEVDIATGSVVRTLLSGGSTPFRGSCYHAASDSIITGEETPVDAFDYQIQKISLATGSVTATAPFGSVSQVASAELFACRGSDLYVLQSKEVFTYGVTTGPMVWWRFNAGTMAFVSSRPLGSGLIRWLGNGYMFAPAGGAVITAESNGVTGAASSRDAHRMDDTMSSGSVVIDAGGSRAGIGSLIIPSGQGPYGVELFWRSIRTTTGTAEIEIRANPTDLGATWGTDVENLHVPSATLNPDSALLGLGWTAVQG